MCSVRTLLHLCFQRLFKKSAFDSEANQEADSASDLEFSRGLYFNRFYPRGWR